jgi:hypothetical protein
MITQKETVNKVVEVKSSDEMYIVDRNIPKEDIERDFLREKTFIEMENRRSAKIYENDITKLDLEF